MRQIIVKTSINFKCLFQALGLFILVLSFSVVHAQNYIKPATLGIHYSLTDFETAAKITSSSFHDVLKNKLWSKPPQMMTGIGVDYLQGISKHIDLAASFNYTKGINGYKLSTTNSTSYALFTLDAVANIKLLSDKYYVRPYLIAGAGLYNQDGTGFYAPLGSGLQFNIFNEALVNVQIQHRLAFANSDNKNFFYQMGIATAIGKKKEKPLPVKPVVETIPQKVLEPVVVVKTPAKNIKVIVTDEATGFPLPDVAVEIKGNDGKKLTGNTDANGSIIFDTLPAADYTVSGLLNNISTTTENVAKNSFNTGNAAIDIHITHNDPRFTLQGQVINKTTNLPEAGVTVSIKNETQNSIIRSQSQVTDGKFIMQLDSESDFSVSGKKADYLSNIEGISTKGLNRSTTLYVKLELAVQDASVGTKIVLNKIYFETGKSVINTTSSSDLDRLVLFMNDNPTVKLEIGGHTDNIGKPAGNLVLSQKRANAVLNYLVSKAIGKERISAKGMGQTQPIADNATADGRSQNRRVEIKVVH
ncbi:OmpA family protein [Limnovirga soli]|nr:OmpA family protein [Limnovirga soli]